jgi:DNA polymerase III alpha subunit
MSFADVDRITKLVPHVLNFGLKQGLETEPGFGELAKKDPCVQEVIDVALRLDGLARNSSVHTAGVVISPEPLKTLVISGPHRQRGPVSGCWSSARQVQLLHENSTRYGFSARSADLT